MLFQCKLVILTLALTPLGQVYAGKIYGGHEAKPHSRPYMVLVERDAKIGKTKHCGGFLLNKDFVMTSAHCQADSYKVFLGLHDASKRAHAQARDVEATYPHENYDAEHFRNDIMLLKLSTEANFDEHVRPIALADQDDGSLPKSCMVSGWGRSSKKDNYMSTKLMEAKVTLTDYLPCANDKIYCSEGETGPGTGDSGGPLVCEDGEAYGVVSITFPVKPDKQYHGYTKIPEFKEWIKTTMERA